MHHANYRRQSISSAGASSQHRPATPGLGAIAASIQDPARREEVQRIIARLSHRAQEWPDDAEMIRLRLKCSETDD